MINECKNLRQDLVKAIEKEMMGPGSEGWGDSFKNEIISENPMQRYSVGILYPQKLKVDTMEEIDDTGQNFVGDKYEAEELLDSAVNIANQYYPSAMGISFYTTDLCPELKIKVSAATYRRLKTEECSSQVEPLPDKVLMSSIFVRTLQYKNNNTIKLKEKINKTERDDLLKLYEHEGYKKAIHYIYNLQNNGWIRVPIHSECIIPKANSEKVTSWEAQVTEGLKLHCVRRPSLKDKSTLFTVTLINDFQSNREKKDEKAFFQVGFSVVPINCQVEFLDYNMFNKFTHDPEELSLALLYRHKKTYAVGHGCATSWKFDDHGKVKELKTEILPKVEVPLMKFDIEELDKELKTVLSMKNLSDLSEWSKSKSVSLLRSFCRKYEEWISKTKNEIYKLDSIFQSVAKEHIDKCSDTLNRMNNGVTLLENDEKIYTAFQLANRAMFMQRLHSDLQLKSRFPEDELIKWPDYQNIDPMYACWRPFQLAFLLLNISGISDEESFDRNLVDLIWFPTGGGKTEAYLGVSAFLIFLRRLKHKEKGLGTAIIMRYTLRLLTAQQFQRAATLICACELIRREMPEKLGNGEISIGLWIGSASTPNDTDSALTILDKLVAGSETKNPFQVLSCPWCGTKLVREKQKNTFKGSWGYKRGNRPKRFVVHCTDLTCAFHNELPIKIVDEDIYKSKPTLLFGTVDKFALMPWKKEIANIFALDAGNDCLSPELIIQDELHLISGPLGTIVGIYETALEALCSEKGISPKIIASTATIRRAGDQVRALYNREVRQFPPPGIDSRDSFFAREASLDEKPGRLYLGLMATGRTMTSTQVRAMSALLQYLKEMNYPNEVKDKYWTLVGYFNTIRELGKTSTLVEDDIKDQVRRIAIRRGSEIRQFYEAEELTSRKSAEEIPAVLERLKITYPNKGLIEILLASNMISVGVDVDRLGLMTVISQPKTTSEYIQATSRVGRKYPGLILTLYDGARSRDRSHYERFTSYHEAFYKHVEPTSVTPFSGPARDRALHAVLVSLVRHLAELRQDSEAQNFKADLSKLNKIVQVILNRVKDVMPEEYDDTRVDLTNLINYWCELTEKFDELYYAGKGKHHLLFPAGRQHDKHWETLQSMRNVDVECNVTVID